MSLLRRSVPLVDGRIIRRDTMPKKQVAQYTCERCSRVWYLDSDAPEPPVKLKLLFELGRDKNAPEGSAISYECLCESCSETVTKLVESLAPLKPRAPRAKKKDTTTSAGPAGQGTSPQPTDPPTGTTTDVTPAVQRNGSASSPAPAPSSAGGSSGGGGQRPSPPASPHPKR